MTLQPTRGVRVLEWSLVSGAVPVWVTVLGAVSLAVLVFGWDRRWWTRRVPLVGLAAALVAVVVKIVMDDVWRPFPDALPPAVLFWVGVGTVGVGLAVVRPGVAGRHRPSARWGWHRLAAAGAALLVVAAAAAQVNRYYGQYPTVGTALGIAPANKVAFSRIPVAVTPAVGARPGPVEQTWRPPAGMLVGGVVSQVPIPSRVSGFAARSGWVYLPPAYLASPRALLPVLVLVAGQPGTPRDWLDGGRLSDVMDRFARDHHGLAPVVVIPDDLGSGLANPLCVDSRLGHVETYLAVDVPAWIRAYLQVNPDPRAWAIGGFSQGGTCALQMAVRAPQVYPTFVDISGQAEPTLGSRQRTVERAFGGDQAAFVRVNPLNLLASSRYPMSAGTVVVGHDDATYRPQQQRVFAACRAAGIDTRWLELPGGHNWRVWGPGLEQSLPWLGTRLGLTA